MTLVVCLVFAVVFQLLYESKRFRYVLYHPGSIIHVSSFYCVIYSCPIATSRCDSSNPP